MNCILKKYIGIRYNEINKKENKKLNVTSNFIYDASDVGAVEREC